MEHSFFMGDEYITVKLFVPNNISLISTIAKTIYDEDKHLYSPCLWLAYVKDESYIPLTVHEYCDEASEIYGCDGNKCHKCVMGHLHPEARAKMMRVLKANNYVGEDILKSMKLTYDEGIQNFINMRSEA